MLRTNSKKVSEKIKAYIIDNFVMPSTLGYEEFTAPETNDYKKIAFIVYQAFVTEKYFDEKCRRYYGHSEETAFVDWCSGLPSILDTPYYYRVSAVDVLGDILEETETERNKFSEMEAEKMLSRLIYREIKKAGV